MDNKTFYYRISKIEVNNLFGKVNYSLDFEDGNDVSIMIAPNGYGKTTILKLLNAALNPSYHSIYTIRTIVFDSFKCQLSNGATICLFRQGISDAEKAYFETYPEISKSPMRQMTVGKCIDKLVRAGYGLKLEINNQSVSDEPVPFYITAYMAQNMFSSITYRMFSSEDEFRRRVNRENDTLCDSLNQLSHDLLDFLKKYDCYIPVNFITANRLRAIKKESQDRNGNPFDTDPLIDASRYLGDLVAKKLEEYGRKKTEASNTLPKLYVDKGKLPSAGYDVFKSRWSDYCAWLKVFHELGFLDSEESDIGDISPEDYEAFGSFFDVYLESFEKTNDPLHEIYMKFYMFKNIFDERIGSNGISPKTINFTRDGAVIFMDNGLEVKITELSSGEKNDFIMFFNLIFKSAPGELVLIDEPEISLHIEWQETYIDKLISICKENHLQAVVTTHSPHIINGHYDLLKDL